MTATLIISTYNRPDALRLCVLSALRQTRLPGQIVIGDDGSGPETARTVKELQALSPVPITHVWQEDKGFRVAKIRNLSVAAATGDYIIQVDGDIIMDRRFVSDHLALSQLPHLGLFSRGIESRRMNALHLMPMAKRIAAGYKKNRPGIMGCNMSFWREDFVAVNGYDESFNGWGFEDSDLAIRMQMNGVRKHDLKFVAIAWHLHHGHPYMANKDENYKRMQCNRKAGEVRSSLGIDRHLDKNVGNY